MRLAVHPFEYAANVEYLLDYFCIHLKTSIHRFHPHHHSLDPLMITRSDLSGDDYDVGYLYSFVVIKDCFSMLNDEHGCFLISSSSQE